MGPKFPLFLGAVILAFFTSCVSQPQAADEEAQIAPAPVVGRPAPDFAIESKDLPGVSKLSDLRGRVVLINFWASWCGYCRREMPALETVYQKYQDQGFLVLGVNVEETPAQVEEFRREVGFTFPVTMDWEGKIFDQYWGKGIPTSVFLDQRGTIFYIAPGEMTQEQMEQILKEMGVGGP